MGDAIIQATKQGKLSSAGFGQTAPFGGTPRLTNEERARTLVGAGADFGRSDFGVDDAAMRPASVIRAQGQFSGTFDGADINQGDNPRAMPSAQSFLNFGMVHPTVYAAVMGGGSQTPEAIAHTILRIRNPIVATMVHTPEMRTKEHEIAFRNKISSGVNLLMASGQRAEPGKPISPELISALAQLADKVQASGEHASRRETQEIKGYQSSGYGDGSVPITYADNLMVDRSTLPKLPIAQHPAPKVGLYAEYDHSVALDLLKAGHSDMDIGAHLGVSWSTIKRLRAKNGIAPIPRGGAGAMRAGESYRSAKVQKVIDSMLQGQTQNQATNNNATSRSMDDVLAKAINEAGFEKTGEGRGTRYKKRQVGPPAPEPAPKRRGRPPKAKNVEPSPSDSLSDKTHEAQVRETPSDQSKLMKREQLEGDMNG